MAVSYYDKAFIEKLNRWTTNTELHVYGPDETRRLFEVIADTHDDKPIKLPILCLRRRGGYTILNPNKKPLTYDGITLDANEEKTIQLNAIPISIPYQLDIYTRYYEEADEYVRNLIFNIVNYPTLSVTIPYNNANIEHNATIRVAAEVGDNSDIPERLVPGQFTRQSLTIDIDDAYLFDARIRDNYSIDAQVNMN